MDDELIIQDQKSRNGVLISGIQIDQQDSLLPGNIVTLGTTSFIVYDREGEMHTIISPLLPSIVKVLQGEEITFLILTHHSPRCCGPSYLQRENINAHKKLYNILSHQKSSELQKTHLRGNHHED